MLLPFLGEFAWIGVLRREHDPVMRWWQLGISANLSPITPPEFVPFSEIPGFTMWPSPESTKG